MKQKINNRRNKINKLRSTQPVKEVKRIIQETTEETIVEEKVEEKKEQPKPKFQVVNGVVVMMSPEAEQQQQSEVKKQKFEVVEENGIIAIQSKDDPTEIPYITDVYTEDKANQLNQKIKQENKERAQKAAVKPTPKKVGDVVIAHTDCYDDLDISALDSNNILDNNED